MTATPSLKFDSSLSGQYSTSYCDLAWAEAYFQNHYNAVNATTWDALAPNQQQAALIVGCRVIETARFTNYVRPTDYAFFYDYITGMVRQLAERMEPIRYQNSQRLQFPRNVDIDIVTGLSFIPEEILMAQCEQALYMLSYDGQAVANRMQGIIESRTSVGRNAVSVTEQYLNAGSAFSPMALELARPLFLSGGQRMRRA